MCNSADCKQMYFECKRCRLGYSVPNSDMENRHVLVCLSSVMMQFKTCFSCELIETDGNDSGQCLFSHVTFDDTGSLIAGELVLFCDGRICHVVLISLVSCDQISCIFFLKQLDNIIVLVLIFALTYQ